MVLSALEIDTQFNVNVLTGSDGVLRGASGGHCDTAIASALSIMSHRWYAVVFRLWWITCLSLIHI